MKKLIRKFLGDDTNREVSNKEMVNYAIGVFGQNNAYNLIVSYFVFFCTDVLYLDVLMVGAVIAISRIWDAINDPIVGIFIDRHAFKNGEKLRPYIRIMAIPIGLLTILMFTDIGLSKNVMLIYIFVIYFVWDLLYSFQDIAQWGMVAKISTNSEERGRAAQFARVGGMIGGWLPAIISFIIGTTAKNNQATKIVFFVAAIILGLGGMLVSTFAAKTKERTVSPKQQGSVAQDIKLLFKNKIVIILVIANILSCCTLYIPQIYFFKYMVNINIFGHEINGLTMNFIFGLLTAIPSSLAIFFATWFSKKIGGMKNLLLLATVLNITVRIIAFFIGYEGYRLIILGALLAIAGIPNGMTGIASTALWADSIDYVEWKTGQRNEGIVFSMQGFIAKIGTGISTFFSTLTLSLLAFDATKYDKDLPQSDVFNKWVWPVYILAPALGGLLYLIPLLMLKIDTKEKKRIEMELKQRHESENVLAQDATKLQLAYDERYKNNTKIDNLEIY